MGHAARGSRIAVGPDATSWGIRIAVVCVAACYSPSVQDGSPCDDGHPCPSPLICDEATHTCRFERAGFDGGACEPGYESSGGECVDIDECARGTDDCSVDGLCANEAGAFSCACKPGFTGDGRACTRVCTSLLLYADCPAPSTSCAMVSASTAVIAAAAELGIQVQAAPTANEQAFRTLVDAGGFDLLIFDSSRASIATQTADRVAGWVNGGGRSIVVSWNLSSATAGFTLRTALGVDTTGSHTIPLDVHRDPASPVDLFNYIHPVPSPLRFNNVMLDDGDELELTGAGFLAARQPSPTGDGAIAVTRDNRAITLGFLPIGLVGKGDTDDDGTSDVQELYTNLIGYLCGY